MNKAWSENLEIVDERNKNDLSLLTARKHEKNNQNRVFSISKPA
jgi:hypothetical protein